jgi:hypothetical protein
MRAAGPAVCWLLKWVQPGTDWINWASLEIGCPLAPNLYRSVEQFFAIGAALVIGSA